MSAGLLIYAIAPIQLRGALEAALARDIGGVGQARLELVCAANVGAIVSRLCGPHRLKDVPVELLLEYEQALANLHDLVDIVPCRYGSVLPHEQAIQRHLADESARYLDAYQRIAGCSEYSVRLPMGAGVAPQPAPGELRSGAAFLRARKHHYAHAEQLESRKESAFSALVEKLGKNLREHVVEALPRAQGLRAMLLVSRTAHAILATEFRAWRTTRDSVLTGPWPPFHFV